MSTQPRSIPDSKLWALTNMRSDRKLDIIDRVLAALDYPDVVRRRVKNAIVAGVLEQNR